MARYTYIRKILEKFEFRIKESIDTGYSEIFLIIGNE